MYQVFPSFVNIGKLVDSSLRKVKWQTSEIDRLLGCKKYRLLDEESEKMRLFREISLWRGEIGIGWKIDTGTGTCFLF